MPSLPPDALASGAGSGPRVPEIVDPLVAAPSAPDTALEQAAAGDGSGMAGAPAAGTAAAEPAWQQPPGGEFAPAEALGVAPLSEGVRFSEPPPEASVTMQDFSLPGTEETDPDELHWRETYDRFRELKLQLGEPTDRISFEKFAAKLKKNRADLLARHHCKGVRFSVYEKDGRAAIKASAIR